MTKLTSTKQHSAHQNRKELQHWRPDRHWYHPLLSKLVVSLSHTILGRLNTLHFENKEKWDSVFADSSKILRSSGRGLLSFSNHVSLFDDPLLISSLGITDHKDIRWIAADHKNFFGNNLKGLIYSAGKCVPIIRGGGLDQPGFDFLIERLRQGDWVHIFPEGGRSREPNGRLQLPLKIGIGKLIYEARPLVIPFYHYGMHDVLPIGSAIPRTGKRVRVCFGDPRVVDRSWWLRQLGQRIEDVEPQYAWRIATNWAEDELLKLECNLHPQASPKHIQPA